MPVPSRRLRRLAQLVAQLRHSTDHSSSTPATKPTPAAATLEDFEARVFTSPTSGDVIPYRIFVPRATSDEPLPLVLFHHGGGGTGDDNVGQMEGPLMATWAGEEQQAQHPCVIVAPQMPRSRRFGGGSSGAGRTAEMRASTPALSPRPTLCRLGGLRGSLLNAVGQACTSRRSTRSWTR